MKNFVIIGEAVGKLPNELKQRRPDVEWQDIKDFRNLLIHEYFGVDLEIVWKIINYIDLNLPRGILFCEPPTEDSTGATQPFKYLMSPSTKYLISGNL